MEPEEKEAGCLFGRSARAWGEIILFYLAYYTALVAWFYSMMCFFNAIIDPFEPTLQGDTSFLKSPGEQDA
nr:hypothetical protein BaRGS_005020 [Batillaria attramentaria]